MSKLQYNEVQIDGHIGFEYVYVPKATKGTVELWFLCDLAKYDEIQLSTHASDRLHERGLSEQDIINFFEFKSLKVVWRPDYNSRSGLSARVTGNLKGIGFITVIVDNELVDGKLIVRTMHKITNSKQDIEIYNEGEKLFSEYIDECELLSSEKVDAV